MIPPRPISQGGTSHDLAVCYRIYPRVSRTPIFGFKDKLALTRLSLETFQAATGRLRLKLWFLLDRCPDSYAALVEELFPGQEKQIVSLDGEGNEATFLRQIRVLSAQSLADLVYLAEDDYLYLPGSLEEAVRFMRENRAADFVTLYDHLDYHKMRLHRHVHEKTLLHGRQWRTVASTCLTFMTRREVLMQTADTFATYGQKNSDLGLWLALTKIGIKNPMSLLRWAKDGGYVPYSHLLAWRHCWREILSGPARTLWAPSPSLATHMEITGIAPHIDWQGSFGPRARELMEGR